MRKFSEFCDPQYIKGNYNFAVFLSSIGTERFEKFKKLLFISGIKYTLKYREREHDSFNIRLYAKYENKTQARRLCNIVGEGRWNFDL